MEDIRDLASLSEKALRALNFVHESDHYRFRKHFRSGLRSHIFEVLKKEDLIRETKGEVKAGFLTFPRAVPVKMFRIFRDRFENKEEVFREIRRYKLLMAYLGDAFIAKSEEFIADYRQDGTSSLILCGLQEYIDGRILDPWRLYGNEPLVELFRGMAKDTSPESLARIAMEQVEEFIRRIRKFINATGFIPDLAGIGNLILTPDGQLKLVDINNIVVLRFDDTIALDDKGYPSCDVSVDVLSILEHKILDRAILSQDMLFSHFLTRERREKVKELEQKFYSRF